jgi:uridine kinase
MFLGFSFGILTLFIPPMQGWYYWIIPFFVYFYIKQDNAPKFTFILLNIFYFSYFLVIKKSDFFEIFQFISKNIAATPNLYHFLINYGINAGKLVNIIFTLLQTTLLLNILWIYKKGIESNIQYKIKYQPYLIGLAGDSGSGKTTFANLIKDVFGEKNTAVLEGDDMHKWERGHEMWNKLTHLNPKANKLHTELENAMYLKKGGAIERRHYDHNVGKFTLPKKLESKRVIIFEGLHSLFLNKMRDILDLRIFINPEDQIRLHWKMLRDTKERGHSKDKVIEQIKKREGDSDQYIKSQEQYADIPILIKSKDSIKNIGDEKEQVDIFLEFKFVNDINLEGLLEELAKENLNIDHIVYDNHQVLRVGGEIDSEAISDIARKIIPELHEIIIGEPEWTSNHKGLMQLFVCYYIFEKMRMEEYEGN